MTTSKRTDQRKNETREEYTARRRARYLAKKNSTSPEKHKQDLANRRVKYLDKMSDPEGHERQLASWRAAYHRKRASMTPDELEQFRSYHREYQREWARDWRETDPNALRVQRLRALKRRERNPEHVRSLERENVRRWRARNPEKAREASNRNNRNRWVATGRKLLSNTDWALIAQVALKKTKTLSKNKKAKTK